MQSILFQLPFLLIWAIEVIWQSGFTNALIHVQFTTSYPLPSPPTYDSLSLYHLSIQGGSIWQLSHLFLSLSF